jgi:hypothetical protein
MASIIAQRYDNSLLFTPPDHVEEEEGCHDVLDAYIVKVGSENVLMKENGFLGCRFRLETTLSSRAACNTKKLPFLSPSSGCLCSLRLSWCCLLSSSLLGSSKTEKIPQDRDHEPRKELIATTASADALIIVYLTVSQTLSTSIIHKLCRM